ncbi:MAG TPA: hypothetical protein VHL81_07580 [Gemmatimonadales bacterium]|nr:hypothetical protein [Gemmatimonadales bacterium]
MRRGLRWYVLSALLAAAPACRREAPREPTGPRLEARWSGTDTAAFTAPAVAEWCDSLDLLELRAVAGDTGLALAVYRADTIQPGEYPIRPPDVADTTPPSAALALRWFSRMSVRGVRSDSGTLTLRRAADGVLSGSFRAKARGISDAGRLTVTGSFAGLRARPARRGCTARSATRDSAAGVH